MMLKTEFLLILFIHSQFLSCSQSYSFSGSNSTYYVAESQNFSDGPKPAVSKKQDGNSMLGSCCYFIHRFLQLCDIA
jgi:hypothetical protein